MLSTFSSVLEATPPWRSSLCASKSPCSNANERGRPSRWRPVVLDDSPPLLVPLGRGPPHCQTRDCGRLAWRRFSALLAPAVASARRTAKDHATGQGFDRTPDEGESRVGRSQDSRGTAEAGLFPRGTNGGPISAVIWFGAVIPARGASSFSRITGRYRGLQFLHRADGDIPNAVFAFSSSSTIKF